MKTVMLQDGGASACWLRPGDVFLRENDTEPWLFTDSEDPSDRAVRLCNGCACSISDNELVRKIYGRFQEESS